MTSRGRGFGSGQRDVGRFRHVHGGQAGGSYGSQSADRRVDQDQGCKGSQVSRWKGVEGCSKLAGLLRVTSQRGRYSAVAVRWILRAGPDVADAGA